MKDVAKKSHTLEILEKFDLTASKKFGQNFLVDLNIIHNIVSCANITKETCVIEVGPGIGALTEKLARSAGYVRCYEIDERLKDVLEYTLDDLNNVDIVFQDFLTVDLETAVKELSKEYKDIVVVTNLPYYITSDIIEKVLRSHCSIRGIVAMVQKEVALKFTDAKLKSPMHFMIDYVGHIEYVMTVSKSVFIPAPHVDSAVIQIYKDRNISKEIITVINSSFTAKRKTIYNNLKPLFKEETEKVLNECDIEKNKRAEQLKVEDYIKLADHLI